MLKKISRLMSGMILILMVLNGCSQKDTLQKQDAVENYGDKVYEETISPNKEYALAESDIVYYNIKIYQNKDNTIVIKAESNSEFFEEKEQVLKYDKGISKDDIDIKWSTLMGKSQALEDDQLAVAHIAFLEEGKKVGEYEVNFVTGVMDIIVDIIS